RPSLVGQLDCISTASEKLNEFERCQNEVRLHIKEWREVKDFIEDCENTSGELEVERKEHADELRQINQDINQLEDDLKSLKALRETTREEIMKKVDDFKKRMEAVNEIIESAGLPGITFSLDEMIPKEYMECLSTASVNKSTVPSMPVLPGFPMGFPFALLQSLHQTPPNRALDQAKMKTCDNCSSQIHRNAPTCPMCKAVCRSKNPKRRRTAN
ncbi:hypothetical protein PFISCL1PPCAC_5642, partial [Pristionchus fissidentatus]